MAYRFETDGNFFRVTNTATSEILINEVRSGLKWGYTIDLAYSIYFKDAITNSTEDEIFKISDYSFAFADIVDSDDIAFTTETVFREWLSQRLGFIGDEAIITQFIRDGYTETVPSEDAVHDALELKLDVTALPSNLTLYPTSTASDIATYFKMVTSTTDPDYDSPAVDFITVAVSGVGELLGSLATTAGILTGNPGILPNVTTIGNIKRNSGTGTAEFYFEVYHRDSLGVETLIGTSSVTAPVSNATYEEFSSSLVWNNGDFDPTDRIVIKWYANRIAGGSNPVYAFQLGGSIPVRTVVPVPASVLLDVPIQIGVTEVVDGTSGRVLYDNAGVIGEKVVDTTPANNANNLITSKAVFDGLALKEATANKQNSLAIDGTGVKFPTVDAINSFGITVDLIDALTVDFALSYAYKINSVTNITNAPTTTILDDGVAYTLTNTIAANSVMTITVSTAARIQLNVQKV